MEILSEKIVFDDLLQIEAGEISSGKDSFKRTRLNRQDAAAVLLFKASSQSILLTKQFRYAIAAKTNVQILEIVAGKIEGEASPIETAIRETEEEAGYRIKEHNLRLLTSYYSSPGYSSEMFYIYFAAVTDEDKVAEGGGLADEHESIEIIEMPAQEFKTLILKGDIKDSKTYVAALLAMHQGLF